MGVLWGWYTHTGTQYFDVVNGNIIVLGTRTPATSWVSLESFNLCLLVPLKKDRSYSHTWL